MRAAFKKRSTTLAAILTAAAATVFVYPDWIKIADEGQTFSIPLAQIVRYGSGSNWIEKPVASAGSCTNEFFGNDPIVGTVKECQVKKALSITIPDPVPTGPTDHHTGIIADLSALPAFQPGIATTLLSSATPLAPLPSAGDWEHDGKFRTVCNVSHYSYDDPIVFPGQAGYAHLHTFFGNTGIDADTTSANIRTVGNATCRGGTINLSGYWVPAMIDTSNNRPVVPRTILIYYATGLWTYMDDGSQMMPFPAGLKMVTGDAKATTAVNPGNYTCMMLGPGYARAGLEGVSSIPTCVTTEDELWMIVKFPQCWDGVNLDSPNHRSHMAFPEENPNPHAAGRAYRCPTSHPVVIPEIKYQIMFTVPSPASNMANWKLASDNYVGLGGYSIHGDWMNGWDQTIADAWVLSCVRARRDCGTAQLADGRTTLGFQGNE